MSREIALYVDPMSPTGVATAPGEGRSLVSSPADLPPHRLEIHRFGSHDLAIAFMAGISLVSGCSLAGSNTVSTWRDEVGDTGNVVVVALLDKERDPAASLADAVSVVEHGTSGEEGRLIARHGRERMERDRRDARARDDAVAPLLEVLRGVEIEARWDGNTSLLVRADAYPGKHYGMVPAGIEPAGDGFWVVSCDLASLHEDCALPAPDRRILNAIDAAGATHDPSRCEISFPPCALRDVARTVGRVASTCAAIEPILAAMFSERVAADQAGRESLQRRNSRRRRQANRAGSLSGEERAGLVRGLAAYRDVTHRGQSWGSFQAFFVVGRQSDGDVHRVIETAEATGDAEGATLAVTLLRMPQTDRARLRVDIRERSSAQIAGSAAEESAPASRP